MLKGLAKHVPRLAHLAERSDAMVTWIARDWLETGRVDGTSFWLG